MRSFVQVQNGKDTLEAILTLPANYLDAEQVGRASILTCFYLKACIKLASGSLKCDLIYTFCLGSQTYAWLRSKRLALSLAMAATRVNGKANC